MEGLIVELSHLDHLVHGLLQRLLPLELVIHEMGDGIEISTVLIESLEEYIPFHVTPDWSIDTRRWRSWFGNNCLLLGLVLLLWRWRSWGSGCVHSHLLDDSGTCAHSMSTIRTPSWRESYTTQQLSRRPR